VLRIIQAKLHVDRQSECRTSPHSSFWASTIYDLRYFTSSWCHRCPYVDALSTALSSITPCELAKSALALHMHVSDCREALGTGDMPEPKCTLSTCVWELLQGRSQRTREPLGHIVSKALAVYFDVAHHTIYQVSTAGW
jgi:hypothetical protein